LEVGTAVFLRAGTVHSIDDQSSQKPLRLLQAFVPPGPERVLRDRTQAAGTQVVRGTPPSAPPNSFRVAHESDREPLTIMSGKGKVWLLLEKATTGEDAAYLGVLEAQAGAAVQKHQHRGSAELLFVQKGRAKMTIAGQDTPAEDETAIYIPEDTDHAASFPEPTRAIQIYVRTRPRPPSLPGRRAPGRGSSSRPRPRRPRPPRSDDGLRARPRPTHPARLGARLLCARNHSAHAQVGRRRALPARDCTPAGRNGP